MICHLIHDPKIPKAKRIRNLLLRKPTKISANETSLDYKVSCYTCITNRNIFNIIQKSRIWIFLYYKKLETYSKLSPSLMAPIKPLSYNQHPALPPNNIMGPITLWDLLNMHHRLVKYIQGTKSSWFLQFIAFCETM